MTHDKKKRQDLGIFYTREEIVNFVYNILILWKEKEDKEQNRWESHKPKHYPSVIDPACGEGIFLKKAVEKGFTKPDWIFGLDIDEAVVKKWPDISLLEEFGGDKEKLNAHFFHQNGLSPIRWEQHKKEYYGKLKKEDIKNEKFNLVVGNPPYGGVGIGIVTDDFEQALINFEVWKRSFRKDSSANAEQMMLMETKEDKIRKNEKERLKNFPIEVLFIDRFIQLAKPGGWIAIIIPDGILSNSNLHYVRQYIADNAKVEAIVSLPRDAFKHVGTSAKTSILFLKKKNPPTPPFVKGDSGGFDYPVFLASLEKLENGYLTEILSQYKEFYMKQTLSKDKKVYSNDFVMVRVDKTLKEMMEEKPSSRWDAGYWQPQFTIADDFFKTIKYPVKRIEDFEIHLTYGPIVVRKKFIPQKTGILILNQTEIIFTGLDFSSPVFAKENSPWVIERAMVKKNDIILARSGVGGVGKNKITIVDKDINACVGCFVDILRLEGINPYYVITFWKGSYGWSQIQKIINGVGTVNINFDEIKSIKIPVIPDHVQSHIESSYKKMAAFHDKAMEARAKGDEAVYKKNIETAEAMLKDLIARTEAVIRGEREDVV